MTAAAIAVGTHNFVSQATKGSYDEDCYSDC